MGFASRLRRFDLRAETGSPRFPGKPSRGFASFSDPGRSIAPCPCMRRAGAAPTARTMKAPTLRITRLHSDASPPAVYASRRAVPHAMPHSLPAGGRTFAGRGSNPQACDERFHPTSWFPPLQGLAWRNRASCPEGWPGSTPIPAPNPCRQARFPETGSVRSPRECERLHVRHRVCGDEPESAVPIGRSRVPTRTDTGPTRTDTDRHGNLARILSSVQRFRTTRVPASTRSGSSRSRVSVSVSKA